MDTQFSKTTMTANPALPESDARKYLHELQVHQVQLEMQNAELQQVRADLESSLARYTNLYDYAPIGYFTLDRKGMILEANLTGAGFLGIDRSSLVSQRLDAFVISESRAAFHTFLMKVFAGHIKEIREVQFVNANQQPFFAHIEATADADRQVCRLIMLDINERKMAEETLRHSQELLHNMVSHQERVKEDERKRIAREIHDELGQNLLALRIDIAMLHARTGDKHPKLSAKVQTALDHLDATMKSMRAIINNLRPPVLDLGLNAAIEWQVWDFERRSGIATELVMGKQDFALDDNCSVAVFRILQESLSNVIRHAQANRVRIDLHKSDNMLLMEVADNGIGIFPDCRRKANSFGLLGIKERVNTLGGTLAISSGQDQGTTLTISIPAEACLEHDAHEAEKLRAG